MRDSAEQARATAERQRQADFEQARVAAEIQQSTEALRKPGNAK